MSRYPKKGSIWDLVIPRRPARDYIKICGARFERITENRFGDHTTIHFFANPIEAKPPPLPSKNQTSTPPPQPPLGPFPPHTHTSPLLLLLLPLIMVAELSVGSKAPKVRVPSFRRAGSVPKGLGSTANTTASGSFRKVNANTVGRKKVVVRSDPNAITDTSTPPPPPPILFSEAPDEDLQEDPDLTHYAPFEKQSVSPIPRKAARSGSSQNLTRERSGSPQTFQQRGKKRRGSEFGEYMAQISVCPDRRPSVLCRRASIAAQEYTEQARELHFSPRDTVKAVIRIRSATSNESMTQLTSSEKGSISEVSVRSKIFEFDKVLDDPQQARLHATTLSPTEERICAQKRAFKAVGVKAVENLFSGFNSCLMAYGQTGSGKTYTMLGPLAECAEEGGGRITQHAERGLIPRICEALFARISEETRKVDGVEKSFRVDIRHLEVYKERARDLLNADSSAGSTKPPKLRVRLHPVTGPFVEGLSVKEINSLEGCQEVIESGARARALGVTSHNDLSSRSHVIFRVTLTQTLLVGGELSTRVANLNLVDLAGSERIMHDVANTATNTNNEQEQTKRQEECATINRSLSTLRRVIDALTSGNKVIPYRESVLTWILSEALGGNSRTILLGTLSPSDNYVDEAIRTLSYMAKARTIVNTIAKNEDETKEVITDLRTALVDLQMERVTTDRHNLQHIATLQDDIELAEGALRELEAQQKDSEDRARTELSRVTALLAEREAQNAELQQDLKVTHRKYYGQAAALEGLAEVTTAHRNMKERYNTMDEENTLLSRRNQELETRLDHYLDNLSKLRKESRSAIAEASGTAETASPLTADLCGMPDKEALAIVLQKCKALQKSNKQLKAMQHVGKLHDYDQETQTDHWVRRARQSEKELNTVSFDNAKLKARARRLEEEVSAAEAANDRDKHEKWSETRLAHEHLEHEFQMGILKKKLASLEAQATDGVQAHQAMNTSHEEEVSRLTRCVDEANLKGQKAISLLHKRAVEAANSFHLHLSEQEQAKAPQLDEAITELVSETMHSPFLDPLC